MKQVYFVCITLLLAKVAFAQTQIIVDAPLACPKIVSILSTSNGSGNSCLSDIYFNCSYNAGCIIQYSIDNGNNWQANPVFEDLPTGFYYCKVKVIRETEECIETYPNNPVVIAQPSSANPPVIESVEVQKLSVCTGTFKVEAIPTQTNPTLQYSLNGINFQSASIFYVPAGRYNLYYRKSGDPCFYIYDEDIEVFPTNFIDTAYYELSKTCSGHSISVTAIPNTGVEYSVDNGTTWQWSNVFSNLQEGYYSVLCRKNGCIYTPARRIIGLGRLEPMVSSVHYTPGPCNGTGLLKFQAPYHFSFIESGEPIPNQAEYFVSYDQTNWPKAPRNSEDEIEFQVPPGINRIYMRAVFIVNNNPLACEYYFDIPLTTGILPEPTYTIAHPQCLLPNGSITFGNSNLDHRYSINNGATWQESNTFTGLAAGTYQLKVKTANNFCFSNTISAHLVNENLPPGFNNVHVQHVTDCNGSNGTITITPAPGNGGPFVSIDNGQTWSQNYTFSNLTSGSYYLKIKNTNNSCESAYANNPVNVTEPAPPVFTAVNFTHVTDCGLNNGTITITATQGSFPIQYSINNGTTWQSNATFTNLTPGSYLIKIRNNNGTCVVTYTGNPVVITSPVPPVITAVQKTNLTNCNSNDGTITITATPGTGTVQYSINNGTSWQDNAAFTNLATGNYLIKVRNSNGTCVVTYGSNPVIITAPLPPVITGVMVNNTTDCGVNDGIISVSATPGSYPVEFSANDGLTWQASNIFQNLAPGNYIIKCRNNNGTCIVAYSSNPVVISGHTAPSITTVSSTDATDCGLNNGSITINALPGEGAIHYSINNGSTWATNHIFNNLAPASYQVKVKNSNGTCAVSYQFNPVEINAPVAPVFVSVTPTNCTDCGVNNGSIQVTATPGSGSLEYSIDNGSTWSGNSNFSNLSPGNYSIKIRNQGGTCVVNYPSNPVIIQSPSPPVFISVTGHNATNCGTNDGSITISATPGSAAVEYSINNGQTYQPSNTFTGLAQGSYLVRIRNQGGTCPVTWPENPVIISAPSAPAITGVTVSQPQSCVIHTGSITILYSAGSGTPQFTIDGGDTWSNNNVFQNIPVGTYQTGIRNADGSCESISTDLIEIEDMIPPTIQNVISSGLIGCTSGFATISVLANGQPGLPLSYSINNGTTWQSSPDFQNISAGTYHVSVRYQTGVCQVYYNANPIILTQVEPPVIQSVESIDPTSCLQPNTGSIHIQATDDENLALSYSINNGQNWTNNPTFSNLSPGIYHISVRNSLGCVSTYPDNPVILNAPSQPVITNIQIDKLPDCGLSNGQITLQYSNSNSVEFSINNGISWQQTPVFSNLSQGSFIILIRNQDGLCQNHWYQNPFVLTQVIDFSISETIVTPLSGCETQDGRIEISVTPPSSQYEYSINNSQTFQSSPVFTGLAAGSYPTSVRRTGTSCVYNNPVLTSVNAQDAPKIIGLNITQPGCNNSTGSIEVITDISDVEYSVDNGVSWQSSPSFSNLIEGAYHIVVRRSNGTCTVYYPEEVQLNAVIPFQILQVNVMSNTDCSNPNGSIEVLTNKDQLEYSIDNGVTWQSSPVFLGLAAGTYSLIVRDKASQCTIAYPIPLVVGSEFVVPINGLDYIPTHDCAQRPAFIFIQASGADLSYSIDGGLHWSDEAVFTDLSPGVYEIAVRKGGCVTYGDTLVFEQLFVLALDSFALTLPIGCQTGDGGVELFTVDLSHTQSYSLDNGVTWQSSSLFTGLNAGTFPVVFMSTQQCVFNVESISLYPSAAGLLENVSVTDALNCNQPDGMITVRPHINQTELQFSIDGGLTWQTDSIFAMLGEGDYLLLVSKPSESCFYQWPEILTVIGKNKPLIDEIKVSSTGTCQAGSGIIEIETSSDNELYSIDGGLNWFQTSIFTGLTDGKYSVVLLDTTSGCRSETEEITLANFVPTPAGNIIGQDVSECNEKNGSIHISIEPQSELVFSINGGTTWQATPDFTDLAPGSYFVLIKNLQNGCVSEPYEERIGWPEFKPDDIEINTLPDYCGSGTGQIEILNAGLVEFSINSGLTWTTSNEFNSLNKGSKEIRIRAGGNCLYIPGLKATIESADSIPVDVASTSAPTCEGMDDGHIELLFPANIEREVSVNWSDGSQGIDVTGPSGVYTAMISLASCHESIDVSIDTSTQENIDWVAVSDTLMCDLSGIEYSFSDTTLVYQWLLSNNQTIQGASQLIAEVGDITLTVSDTNGCIIEDEWSIEAADNLRDFDFLLASEGVIHIPAIAIDITAPRPEGTRWEVQSSHLINEQQIKNQYHMIFDQPGFYTVHCIQKSGDCEVTTMKTIRIFGSADSLTIEPSNNLVTNVKNLTISPNPNNGEFKLSIEYLTPISGTLAIYDASGHIVFATELNPLFTYEEIPVALQNVSSGGIYTLIYQSASGEIRWRNFIVVK